MNKKILVIAPHNDDEILGCGGILIKNKAESNDIYVCIATHGTPPMFNPEGTKLNHQETLDCHKYIGVSETFFLDFPAVLIDKTDRYKINDELLRIIKQIQPNEVFIPHYGDMQKDHQIITDSCMVALRPKYKHAVTKIYCYETLSETGWNIPNVQNEFIPNCYTDISSYLEQKLTAMAFYKSQLSEFPDARSLEAVKALALYRGAQMNMNAAEAFMLVRELNY